MAPRAPREKPRRTREKVETPAGFLATHDLKERGWTARLIAKYLGEHDSERPNGLKMGRRRLPPVKLYREDRVETAEGDEEFLIDRSRSEEAREKRQAARERRERERALRLESAADSYAPRVQRLDTLRKGAVKKAREPYLPELERVLAHLNQELGGLKGGEEKALRDLLLRRLSLSLSDVYDWYPHPDHKANKARAKAGASAGTMAGTRVAVESGTESTAKPSDWREWDWDSEERG